VFPNADAFFVFFSEALAKIMVYNYIATTFCVKSWRSGATPLYIVVRAVAFAAYYASLLFFVFFLGKM
jgi:hypothetical protein